MTLGKKVEAGCTNKGITSVRALEVREKSVFTEFIVGSSMRGSWEDVGWG